MSDANHTPGPWTIRPGTPPPLFSIQHTDGTMLSDDGYLETIPKEVRVGTACGEANAALIAAAPDLLEGCERSLDFVRHSLEFFNWSQFPNLEEGVQDLRTRLESVILKVKGTPT